MSDKPLLEITNLTIGFDKEGGEATQPGLAVNDVSFAVERGKTLCLVGESGCGKSVTAHAILRLLPSPPARIVGGSICFARQDVLSMSARELCSLRGGSIGMIFQDPMSSLNPVMKVGRQTTEGLQYRNGLSTKEAQALAISLFEKVGIPDPSARVNDFPHQMSGGMRQRVMIAMAIAESPELLIADEPTTALDVTVQRQILDLIKTLVHESGSGMLLISHDLGVVKDCADDVAVMYSGVIVEQGPAEVLLESPKHPYTQGLLHSRVPLGKRARKADRMLTAIRGSVPGLWNRPTGCSFHPRCDSAMPVCSQQEPPLFYGEARQNFRCWLGSGQK